MQEFIDHTNLRADARRDEIIKLCQEAREYGFKAVCVNPYYVELASLELAASGVEIATVIGFPLGQNTTAVKVFELKEALRSGATEIDAVINIAAVKDGDWEYYQEELHQLKKAACGVQIKLILETGLLTSKEIAEASRLAVECGYDFLKTSTGYQAVGATIEAVEIMKAAGPENLQIKAAGGIRDLASCRKFIEAGATRIGTSSAVKIMSELQN
ncbi:MAG: deoxyribose-phosphate aldolase [Eubacteriales bacterium]|nr:deoxyribose-phosphate aldolase [Eubacteriales bacterium]